MSYTESINSFLGLNLRDRVSAGELCEMHNCSTRRYPLLSPRLPRGLFDTFPSDEDGNKPEIGEGVVNNALFFPIKYGNYAQIACAKNINTRTVTARYSIDSDLGIEYFGLFGYIPLRIDSIKYGDEDITLTDYRWDTRYGTVCWSTEETYEEDETIDVTGVFLDVVSTDKYAERANQLVAMGTYIIHNPSGFYFDANKYLAGQTYDYGTVGRTTYSISGCKVQVCDRFGEAVDAVAQNTAPSAQDGKYWVDTSGVSDLLKRYSAEYQKWVDVSASCFMIRNATAYFTWMDVGSSIFYTIGGVEKSSTVVAKDESNKWIIVEGDYPTHSTNISVTLSRKFPYMDFICECENRLWGCRYGTNNDGESVNEIYASALGDFKSWYNFQGLSTDSYMASRGCPGEWTGCVNYLGSPTFFKENYIECVYPSATGAHQISTLHINGTGCTSPKSLRIVDNVLFYQGSTGFFAYSGSLPNKISDNFAENYYHDTVGGDLSGFYYAACKDKDNKRHLFVYDVGRKLWVEEDDVDIDWFGRVNSELYSVGKTLISHGNAVGRTEKPFWQAITGDMGISYALDNGVAEVAIRASVGIGEAIKVLIAYDGSEHFEQVGFITGNGEHKYVTYPLVPARCDHYKLKFVGNGNSAVWSVTCKEHIGGRTK